MSKISAVAAILISFCVLSPQALQAAPTPIPTVALNDDNLNTAGDLGSAVTALNANYLANNAIGTQDILFHLSSAPITLGSGALGVVTLLGPTEFSLAASSVAPNLYGTAATNAGPASLLASSGLVLDQGMTLGLTGGLASSVIAFGTSNLTGGAAGVTAASVSLSAGSALDVTGGTANDGSGSLNASAFGGTSSFTAGSVSLAGNSTLSITGGGMNNPAGQIANGAQGGSASVSAGSFNLATGSLLDVSGGGVTDSNSGFIGGTSSSGSAFVTAGSLALSDGSAASLTGGNINNLNGGFFNGQIFTGQAVLTAGSISLGNGSILAAAGGQDMNGSVDWDNANATTGGAWVTAGSITLGTGSTLAVSGGELDDSNGGRLTGEGFTGGAGLAAGTLTLGDGSALAVTAGFFNGNASLNPGGSSTGSAWVSAGSVSFAANGLFTVAGGNSLYGNSGSNGAAASAGNASVTLGSFASGDSLAFQVLGGGISVTNFSSIGLATTAGNASVSLGSFSTGANSAINVAGGNILNASYGIIGGHASGGAAAVTAGTLSLGTDSGFTVAGGAVSNNASVIGVNVANGASGGNAWVSVGALTLSSGSFLDVEGGLAQNVGGTIYGTAINGSATLMLGSLTGPGTVTVNGASAQLEAGSGNFSGVIAGDAGLLKTGSGALTLSGTNTYSGATTLAGGTLNIQGDGQLGTSGQLALNGGTLQAGGAFATTQTGTLLAPGGTVDVNGWAVTWTGAVGGSGGLAETDSGNGGILALSGTNSYSGGTTVEGATLLVSADANLGSGVLVLDGGALRAGAGFSMTRAGILAGLGGTMDLEGQGLSWSGTLSGGGLLAVTDATGSGALTLSGANGYTGGTVLLGGNLWAGNSSALGTGNVWVNGGGLGLSGSNYLLNIGGSYVQGPQGTLSLALGSVQSDRLAVQGSAYLSGTLQVSALNSFQPAWGSAFNLLRAQGGLNGAFSQVESSVAGYRFMPIYYANDLVLETLPGSFASVGFTANQKAVGADLDALFTTPQAAGLMRSLGTLTTGSAYQKALGEMSPEGLVGFYRSSFNMALLSDSFASGRMSAWRGAMDESRFRDTAARVGEGHPAYASTLSPGDEAAMGSAFREGWTGSFLWNAPSFSVVGGYRTTGGERLTADFGKKLSPHLAMGFMLGYGSTAMSLDGGGWLGQSGALWGGYGTFFQDGFYLEGSARMGLNGYSSQRAAYGGTATGTTSGQEYGGRLGVGYEWKAEGLTFGPELAAQYARVDVNGFTESGSLAPLTLPAQGLDSFLGTAGARVSGFFRTGNLRWAPRVGAAYEHEFDDQGGALQAGFGQADGFSVAGPSIGQDGFLLDAGLDLTLPEGLRLSLGYRGELGRANLTSSQFGGGVGLAL